MSETDLQPSAERQTVDQKSRELAAFSYVWVFSLLVLFMKEKTDFVRFHARQAVILFFLSLLLWPWIYTRYAEFLVLVMMIIGFAQSFLGNAYKLPLIGDIAAGTFHWGKLLTVHQDFKTRFRFTPQELASEIHQDEDELAHLKQALHDDEAKISVLENEVHQLENQMQYVNEIKKRFL